MRIFRPFIILFLSLNSTISLAETWILSYKNEVTEEVTRVDLGPERKTFYVPGFVCMISIVKGKDSNRHRYLLCSRDRVASGLILRCGEDMRWIGADKKGSPQVEIRFSCDH